MRIKLTFGRVVAGLCLFSLFIVTGPTIAWHRGWKGPPYTEPLVARWERMLGGDVFIQADRLGDATFRTKMRFLEEEVTLEIHDYNAPTLAGRTVNMGMVDFISDEDYSPKLAYWSGDGTVFVLRDIGLMYDFKRHSTQPPAQFIDRSKGPINPPYDRERFIESRGRTEVNPSFDLEAFIESRGGTGPNLLDKTEYLPPPAPHFPTRNDPTAVFLGPKYP